MSELADDTMDRAMNASDEAEMGGTPQEPEPTSPQEIGSELVDEAEPTDAPEELDTDALKMECYPEEYVTPEEREPTLVDNPCHFLSHNFHTQFTEETVNGRVETQKCINCGAIQTVTFTAGTTTGEPQPPAPTPPESEGIAAEPWASFRARISFLEGENERQAQEIERLGVVVCRYLDRLNEASAETERLPVDAQAEFLEGELNKATAEIERLKQDQEMANGCFAMIYEDLEAWGTDMSKTPHMMCNDAIRATLSRLIQEKTEPLQAEIGRLREGFTKDGESAAEWCCREYKERLQAQLSLALDERDTLRKFFETLAENVWCLDDVDGGGFQDTAESLGLIVKVPADEAFWDEYGADEMYVWAWSPLALSEKTPRSSNNESS